VLSSLRVRVVAVVLLAVIPALGLTVYIDLAQRRLETEEIQRTALRLVRLAASQQERLLEGARQLLIALAQLPEVHGGDEAGCTTVFARLLERYPHYTNLGMVTPSGELACSGSLLSGRGSVTDQAYLRRALESREFVVGDYVVGRAPGKPSLNVGYPVLDPSGRVYGILFGALGLAWLNEVARQVELPAQAVLVVLDRTGTILVRHPDPHRWVGQAFPDGALAQTILTRREGTSEAAGLDGISRLYAFAPIGGTTTPTAYLTIGLSTATAFAEANRLLALRLLGLGLLAAVALGAAWVGTDVIILRRLGALARASTQLSTGELGTRTGVRGRDEIAVVARAFNEMAERLATIVEAEQRARGALVRLHRTAELLEACTTVEDAYSVIRPALEQLFPEYGGAVFALSASRTLLTAVAVWGPFPMGSGEVFQPDECWALRRGRPHLVENCHADVVCQHLAHPWPAAYGCLPLVAQGETFGVLHLIGGPGGAETGRQGLRPDTQQLAVAVAEHLSLALASLHLRETLREQSVRDPLTGLFNRRYMEASLERELQRALRGQYPVGVIMLDLDHFKHFNDTFGHAAGDAVLRELGSLLQASARSGDIACRYGGEEFVLILPEADTDDSRRRAEHLREIVHHLHVWHGGHGLGPLTLSCGIAAFPEHGRTGDGLLRAADAALLRAKQSGRDCVVKAFVDGPNQRAEQTPTRLAARKSDSE
jgi:diguanylate cyclase (GGDEF)-like protein